jgi:hypothetical protein
VPRYVTEWTTSIEDVSSLVTRLRELRARAEHDRAAQLLPVERLYPLPAALRERLRATA